MDRQSVLQEKIDYLDGWNITHRLERAMAALRSPEYDTPVSFLSGAKEKTGCTVQVTLSLADILCLMNDKPS